MKTKSLYIIISSILVCGLLAWIEHGIQINYVIKTGAKIGLFFTVIAIYMKQFNDFRWGDVLRMNQASSNWKRLLLLGIASATVILIAYMSLEPFIDTAMIKTDLTDRLGITPIGFIFVGLYITFGNSLLEEYFFRGFIFFNLPRNIAYVFSPILFAAYHIPMIVLWFEAYQVALCFFGLWLIGVIFHKVNEQQETIWSSWIIHICADVMIIIIGLTLFY
ncbi:CPBP family intramembrane glutamic endopeptidase [Lentibacillus saliphilus]|uniref:CPBP family intramembrane glutamic endopeptidase n=1 Tax=Lentibacillus saliphilus TaxID=2737028 RepID=UPI001C2FF4F7|nr:CPBP family intramembrane glutamic endopeptidase [Lentibacillus saliphilus]